MTDYTRKKIKVVYKDPADLIPYTKNARTHDSEIEFLCNSIRRHGFDASHAIGVDKDMVIIHGHGRRLAAMRLGMKEVPVVVRTDLTEEEVMSFRLADNKVSDLSGWDFDMLDQELAFLKEMDVDMTQFGFDDFTDMELPDSDTSPQPATEDIVLPPEETPAPKVTEEYRLMVSCADSKEHLALFEELKNRGFDCQPML